MNIQKILLTVICCVCALSVMAETSGRWIAWSLLPATRWEDALSQEMEYMAQWCGEILKMSVLLACTKNCLSGHGTDTRRLFL